MILHGIKIPHVSYNSAHLPSQLSSYRFTSLLVKCKPLGVDSVMKNHEPPLPKHILPCFITASQPIRTQPVKPETQHPVCHRMPTIRTMAMHYSHLAPTAPCRTQLQHRRMAVAVDMHDIISFFLDQMSEFPPIRYNPFRASSQHIASAASALYSFHIHPLRLVDRQIVCQPARPVHSRQVVENHIRDSVLACRCCIDD